MTIAVDAIKGAKSAVCGQSENRERHDDGCGYGSAYSAGLRGAIS
jgi:hypothetical protein